MATAWYVSLFPSLPSSLVSSVYAQIVYSLGTRAHSPSFYRVFPPIPSPLFPVLSLGTVYRQIRLPVPSAVTVVLLSCVSFISVPSSISYILSPSSANCHPQKRYLLSLFSLHICAPKFFASHDLSYHVIQAGRSMPSPYVCTHCTLTTSMRRTLVCSYPYIHSVRFHCHSSAVRMPQNVSPLSPSLCAHTPSPSKILFITTLLFLTLREAALLSLALFFLLSSLSCTSHPRFLFLS
jgi:hypothetical protein